MEVSDVMSEQSSSIFKFLLGDIRRQGSRFLVGTALGQTLSTYDTVFGRMVKIRYLRSCRFPQVSMTSDIP